MSRLAKVFSEKTGIAITIRGGGCADGIMAVVSGKFEMGGLCCPLNEKEVEDYSISVHPVARDIKAVIVNRENPVDNLNEVQIRNIHQGRIKSWKELGWVDRPVAVIYRKHCLNRAEPVRRYLGLDEDLDNLTEKAIIVRTDKELIDYVRRFPTAIGITSKVFTEGQDVKIINVDGVEPTAENVKSGRYMLTGNLNIVTSARPDKAVRKFLDFILSEEGQSIIEENLAGIK
jgi:phosphate transport system substrate-binding protein